MSESFVAALEAAAKTLAYIAALAALGTCAVRWSALPAAAPGPPDLSSFSPRVRLARVGLRFATVGVLALLLRAWAHTAVAFGPSEALSWENLQLIALQSAWGRGWRLQALASAATVLSLTLAHRRLPGGWEAATIAALAGIGAVPLVGHAAGSNARWLVHVAHGAGAGVWLGSLASIVLATRSVPGGPVWRARMLKGLSRLALPGSAIVALSGAWAAWLYLGAPSAVVTSVYGRMLLVKLVLVVGVAACGFANWRRYRQVGSEPEPRSGTVWLELVLAGLVIVATGVLTELEHPGE